MPLELTEAQRLAMSNRLMVQAPTLEPAALARVQRQMLKRIQGIPAGDLLALEAMRVLAEQGNKVAAFAYQRGLIQLGIDPRGLADLT